MTPQVEFWTVVSFLLTFMGFVGGLAKWLFSKTEERRGTIRLPLNRLPCNSPPPTGASWKRNLCDLKADLPLNYVRREDYIRGQTVIEAKPGRASTTNWKWYSSTAIPEVNNGRYYPVRRESLRWSLLVALNKTRPYTASETLLLDVSCAIYPDTTQLELRRELGLSGRSQNGGAGEETVR